MKGRLREVLAKAQFADDATLYRVQYRDRDRLVEVSLGDFLALNDVPLWRIARIKREGTVVYETKDPRLLKLD
jgi:hypothetical protein